MVTAEIMITTLNEINKANLFIPFLFVLGLWWVTLIITIVQRKEINILKRNIKLK